LFLYTWYGRRASSGKVYVVAKVWNYETERQDTIRLHRLVGKFAVLNEFVTCAKNMQEAAAKVGSDWAFRAI